MPDHRDDASVSRDDAPRPPNPPESGDSSENQGHLIRGKVDFEDVLDRLSKGVSVPSDLTNMSKSTDKA
jgi:hypothetical protein